MQSEQTDLCLSSILQISCGPLQIMIFVTDDERDIKFQ